MGSFSVYINKHKRKKKYVVIAAQNRLWHPIYWNLSRQNKVETTFVYRRRRTFFCLRSFSPFSAALARFSASHTQFCVHTHTQAGVYSISKGKRITNEKQKMTFQTREQRKRRRSREKKTQQQQTRTLTANENEKEKFQLIQFLLLSHAHIAFSVWCESGIRLMTFHPSWECCALQVCT